MSSDENSLPFLPTYEIATDRLFEEFAAHIIRQSENLVIFQCCALRPVMRECPSWVPDWRYSEELEIPINAEWDSFRAAGTSCWDASTAIANHSLGVEAISLDRLQNITSPGPEPRSFGVSHHGLTRLENDYLPGLKWQQNMIRITIKMTSLSLLYKSEQERWHAWWLTSIGEKKNDMERATPDYERRVRWSYKQIIDGLVDHDWDEEYKKESKEFLNLNLSESLEISKCMLCIAQYRKFCLTMEGRIGWVPRAARTGDIISLMRGSPVPVLIRRSQGRNSYHMIGQC